MYSYPSSDSWSKAASSTAAALGRFERVELGESGAATDDDAGEAADNAVERMVEQESYTTERKNPDRPKIQQSNSRNGRVRTKAREGEGPSATPGTEGLDRRQVRCALKAGG